MQWTAIFHPELSWKKMMKYKHNFWDIEIIFSAARKKIYVLHTTLQYNQSVPSAISMDWMQGCPHILYPSSKLEIRGKQTLILRMPHLHVATSPPLYLNRTNVHFSNIDIIFMINMTCGAICSNAYSFLTYGSKFHQVVKCTRASSSQSCAKLSILDEMKNIFIFMYWQCNMIQFLP